MFVQSITQERDGVIIALIVSLFVFVHFLFGHYGDLTSRRAYLERLGSLGCKWPGASSAPQLHVCEWRTIYIYAQTARTNGFFTATRCDLCVYLYYDLVDDEREPAFGYANLWCTCMRSAFVYNFTPTYIEMENWQHICECIRLHSNTNIRTDIIDRCISKHFCILAPSVTHAMLADYWIIITQYADISIFNYAIIYPIKTDISKAHT